jgi:class I fructose-bisphosphate aldolase
MAESVQQIATTLGETATALLAHVSKGITKTLLCLPGADFVDRVYALSDRSPRVLGSLQRLFQHGRLGGTGYLSILPVDQGIEHSAGASFAPNPIYFDPEAILTLAMEGGCNAVASSFGVLGSIARKYAHKIPFIVKINHNEFLSYPNRYNQIPFGTVKQAHEMGGVAVGATIYFGSPESDRQIVEVAQAFETAHDLGMATVLWCYARNAAFQTPGNDYHLAADITGQANHLGVTIRADIIKQKFPENNGGFTALKFGKNHPLMYTRLAGDPPEGQPAQPAHPIDLCRYQLANCYMGRSGLITSGGAAGKNDLRDAVYTAVVNKRAGGTGVIMGRKAFQKEMREGVALMHAVQDVYLCPDITVA